MAALHAHERFRRGSRERAIAASEEEHVGRRIHETQRAIDVERIPAERPFLAAREHHLDHVARGDVLLRAIDVRGVLRVGHVERAGPESHGLRFLPAQRLREELLDAIEPRDGGLPRGIGCAAGAGRVRDDRDAAAKTIEDEPRLRQQKNGFHGFRALPGRNHDRRVMPDGVVPHPSDRASAKRRRRRERARVLSGRDAAFHPAQREHFAQRAERVGGRRRLRETRPAPGRDGSRSRFDDSQRLAHVRREDRVATPDLASLDALQEEALPSAIDLRERGERRLEIGEHLAPHRRANSAAPERAERRNRRCRVHAHRPPGAAV